MKRKLLALVLAFCMVLGMIPAVSAAETVSGTYGENIQWSFDESTGVLTLSGVGDMEQTDAGYPWLAYKDAITRIVFDPSLTEIGDEAFYGCTALTSVEIPGTVEEIGSFAFGACTALETVKIADGVTWIGMYVFDECTALKHVTLPNTVEELNNTFDSCTALEQVTVPEGVKVMWDTFAQCYNLKSVELPSTVERIFGTFADCRSLTSVNLPEGLEVIGTNTFFGCISLKNLVIPSTVTVIQSTCFCGGKDANGSYQKGVDPIYFLGNAPEFSYDAFDGDVFSQEITCYYPEGNDTWTEDVMQDYGGDVAWVSYNPETDLPENSEPTEPEPTDPEPTEPAPTDPEPTDPVDPEPIENPFTDVAESNFFYEPVLWAVDNGITSGVSATRFAPGDPCTRAQVVTFLWRAAGEPQPTATKNPFTDVKASAYYYDAVLWAMEEGITTGMSATSFGPNSPCTRGQVVTFLHRAAGETEPASTKNPFTDVKETGFYYDAVLWAVENSITTGTSATKFSPNQTCTRGQVVTFLYRAD